LGMSIPKAGCSNSRTILVSCTPDIVNYYRERISKFRKDFHKLFFCKTSPWERVHEELYHVML
jgi:hypothetical protein